MRKPLLAVAIATAVAVPVLVLDPIGLLGPSFEFEATHMRAAIEGTWTLELTRETDQAKQTVELEIRQAGQATQTGGRGLVPSASACGNRSFVRSAAACVDSSDMPLEVTVLSDPAAPRVTGRFMVSGTSFDRGFLAISFGEYRIPYLEADVLPTGKTERVASLQGHTATFTRTAVPPATIKAP